MHVSKYSMWQFFCVYGVYRSLYHGRWDESTLLTNRSSEKDEKTDKSMETFEFTSLLRCWFFSSFFWKQGVDSWMNMTKEIPSSDHKHLKPLVMHYPSFKCHHIQVKHKVIISFNMTNVAVVALRGLQPGGVVHPPNPWGWLLGEIPSDTSGLLMKQAHKNTRGFRVVRAAGA